MPEDAAPETPETPDAPEPADPEGTPAEPQEGSPADTNWQERYEHLQPAYTRATQEASQYRQIIDLAREGDPEALAALGLEVEADEEEDDLEAEEPLTRAEFEAWQREQHEALSQAEKEQEFAELQQEFIDQEISRLAPDASERVQRHLTAVAFEYADEDGIPDFDAAKRELDADFEDRREAYLKTKHADRVEVGTAGTEKVNLADDDSRVDYLATALEAGNQDE